MNLSPVTKAASNFDHMIGTSNEISPPITKAASSFGRSLAVNMGRLPAGRMFSTPRTPLGFGLGVSIPEDGFDDNQMRQFSLSTVGPQLGRKIRSDEMQSTNSGMPLRYGVVHYLVPYGSGMSSRSQHIFLYRPWWTTPEVFSSLITDGSHAKTKSTDADHQQGDCKPCAYFAYKTDGCRWGEDCEFCHICTRGDIKKKKKRRSKMFREMRDRCQSESAVSETSSVVG